MRIIHEIAILNVLLEMERELLNSIFYKRLLKSIPIPEKNRLKTNIFKDLFNIFKKKKTLCYIIK